MDAVVVEDYVFYVAFLAELDEFGYVEVGCEGING